ncbi:hypothetical protein ACKFRK_04890 [Corynebacterium kefirresidentii]|uniref:hypothetical protein n=2 Tax=Corynebacterium TaxID=1716 RepID=UPI0038D02A7F
MALCGGDGAAGPAAGGVSALGVGADVGVRDVGVYFVGVKPADEGVVCGRVAYVYPSGAWDVDAVCFWVGGKGVDSNAGVGVFQDEVDKSLCCGGFRFIDVGVDVAGDDGGCGAVAGQ